MVASTGFMAAPGGFSATLSNKLDKIDCSQILSAVLLADRQVLGHIPMGKVAHNIEVNWIEDELNATYIVGSSAGSTAIETTGKSVATLNRILRSNSILRVNGTSTLFRVAGTCDATDSISVALYASTAHTAWTTGTKIYVVAAPKGDIATASDDISLARTKRKNFMQVFERGIEITQTRKNMDMEAVSNELMLQIRRRTMEIKRELNMSVLSGHARVSAANTFSGDHELRTMAGIAQLIRDPNLDTTLEDTTVLDKTASALTQAMVNSLAYLIWDKGGLDEESDCIIVCGANQARIMSAWESEIRRVDRGERTIGYYKNVFETDMGYDLPIVMDRWCPRDQLFIVDRNRISLRPMKGDNWHMEKMAKTGRSEKWQLSGQFTLDMRHADACHGLIFDLSG